MLGSKPLIRVSGYVLVTLLLWVTISSGYFWEILPGMILYGVFLLTFWGMEQRDDGDSPT